MALSQSVRKGQVPVNCKLCESDRLIQWKCIDCSLLLCSHCKDNVHSKFKNAQDHRIISTKEVELHTEKIDITNIKCQEHAGLSSCLYCNTCDILVCPTCIAKVHKKHDFIEIIDAYNMKVERLEKSQSKMKKSSSKMDAKKIELNKVVSAENLKYSQVRQTILSHEKRVKVQVDNYFKELIDTLDQNHETVLISVKSDLNDISLFTNQTEDKINEVQNFIEISDATEFFKGVNMMQISTEIKEPQTKPSYRSSPKFVPGSFTQSDIGSFKDDGSLSAEINISLVINNEYQTELESISYVSPCLDRSLWLSSGTHGMLQRVKPEETKLKVISKFNIKVYGIAVTPSNQLLISMEGKTRLQQISNAGELVDSVYDVTPFFPIAIHVISGSKLLVGAYSDKLRSSVIIMNKKGDKEFVYKHDQHSPTLITVPKRITSTNNGNIHVVDQISEDFSGKVVVLGHDGHLIYKYSGLSATNKTSPFKPRHIVTTPSDNVVVIDRDIPILHILNNNGHFVSYFNTEEIGIQFPYSLAFNTTGHLYIGCTKGAGHKSTEAKLYETNIAEF